MAGYSSKTVDLNWVSAVFAFFGPVKETNESERRWRLILGGEADPDNETTLSAEGSGMDKVLEALYGEDREASLGGSSPKINRWLGDIRKYFPTPVVQMMQRDALKRHNLERMLLEPELLESIEPDVHLVSTLLSLNKVMPDQTRSTAREVVRRVVEQLEKRLRLPLERKMRGALHRAERNRRPRLREIDWNRTIRANLKNYQPDYRTVIPEHLHGHGRRGRQLKHLILLVDQSGSMATSVVYSSIFGAILSSISSLKTHFVVFDTSVVDLTAELRDPVDLLFGTQLGGGTDIERAVRYGQQLIERPRDTIVVLITDLYEGGDRAQLLARLATMQRDGVKPIVLLALNDEGAPAYDRKLAEEIGGMDIPVFASTPEEFIDLLAEVV